MFTFTAILLSLLFSAFFSGIEIAYISTNRLRIELKRKKGSKRAQIMSQFLEKPSTFLGTTLVGNNIALVVFGSLMETVLGVWMAETYPSLMQSEVAQMLSITIVTTLVVLFFGEFIPKALFRINSSGILLFFAYPLMVIRSLLAPLVWVMVRSSYAFLGYVLGIKQRDEQKFFTKLDLEHFIESLHEDEHSEDIDTKLFQRALYLNDLRIRDCMVPRSEIKGIDVSASIQELRDEFVKSKHSRLIVYNGDVDNIVGYVHQQQLLHSPSAIKAIMFPMPQPVPEVGSASELMDKLSKQDVSLAWVVDEFGTTAGIVTLEDILEEIFGDIEDEHDQPLLEKEENDDTYYFSGRLELDHLNDTYDLQLPEGDYQTLSGYIVNKLETIPKQGFSFAADNYRFYLTKVSNTRIEEVKMVRIEDTTEG